MKNNKGFTLIELLVVIGILATLLAITLIAINPARQFQQANDTQRKSDVNALLNAVHQFGIDNKGTLPAGITASPLFISDTGADICTDLISTYLAELPTDPTIGGTVSPAECSGAYDTGYTVMVSATNNRVTVAAPSAELGAIEVTR